MGGLGYIGWMGGFGSLGCWVGVVKSGGGIGGMVCKMAM